MLSQCLGLLLIASSAATVCPAPRVLKVSDAEIAAQFAPIFYQALGDRPRSDYITNFDFDGDWKGDNNWEHVDDEQYPLQAYIYYSLEETASHFFIHYAVFHPRDYKGGERKGAILSDLIREGAKRGGQYDPTGMVEEVALAHENDMEGCLVVVSKKDNKVAFVETLHHNNFSRYVPGEAPIGFGVVKVDDGHVLLYVEPKGHGIEAFTGDEKQTARKDFLRYECTGVAQRQSGEVPICHNPQTEGCKRSVSYALLPIETTLWSKAKSEPNETYGEVYDYGSVTIDLSLKGSQTEKTVKLGKLGCAFLGKVGGHNMARPPWGWFDMNERDQPLGRWFLDPASIIKRDFSLGDSFATAYVRVPFWVK